MRTRTNTDAARTTEFSSIQDFHDAAHISDGRIVVDYQDHVLDFELDKAPADTLLVCFHGALTRDVDWPMLVGQGVTAELTNVSRLSIADPSIGMNDTLPLAWYAGNEQMPELQQALASVVDKVATVTGAKHIVFFGSSGGGFAALQISRQFPGSLALVMNPQTSIGEYIPAHVRGYLLRCWDKAPLDTTPIDHDLTVSYAQGFDNTVAYVQNTRDTFHVENHMQPFLGALSNRDNVWTFMDAWGTNPKALHIIPPKGVVTGFLGAVTSCDGDWAKGLQQAGFAAANESDPLAVTQS